MGLHQSRIRHHGRSRNKHANEGPFADKKVEAAIDAALAKETKSPSPEPRMVQAPNTNNARPAFITVNNASAEKSASPEPARAIYDVELPNVFVGAAPPISVAADLLVSADEVSISRQRLGKGAFATVYAGTWQGQQVAVKICKVRNRNMRYMSNLAKEIRLMHSVSHGNVLPLLAVALNYAAETIMLVTPLAVSSLWSVLHSSARFELDDDTRLDILQQTARAVAYLHALPVPILHRDLKSPNVLLTEDNDVLVCDFGLARDMVNLRERPLTPSLGTAEWTAREVFAGSTYGKPADVYSLGILCWELFNKTDEKPFERLDRSQIAHIVLYSDTRPAVPAGMPREVSSLMQECWHTRPLSRPTADEVVEIIGKMRQSGAPRMDRVVSEIIPLPRRVVGFRDPRDIYGKRTLSLGALKVPGEPLTD